MERQPVNLAGGHNFRNPSEYFRGLNEAAGNMNRLGVRIARAEKTNAADRCADKKDMGWVLYLCKIAYNSVEKRREMISAREMKQTRSGCR